jgi:hypothetical protein
MSEMLNTDLLVARLKQAEGERDEARGQLEKVSPLVSAVHRIATNDGHGEHGDMWLEEINRIAKDALAAWHLKNQVARVQLPRALRPSAEDAGMG